MRLICLLILFTPFFSIAQQKVNGGKTENREVENNAWGLNGNSGTNPSRNFIGTTDRQPLIVKSDSAILIKLNTAKGIDGHFSAKNYFIDGSWVSAIDITNRDSTLGLLSTIEIAKGQVEAEVKDEAGIGYWKLGGQTFNVGDYQTKGEQYLFLDWGIGQWTIGNTRNFSSTIVGDTVTKTVTVYADSGLVIKNAKHTMKSDKNDSLRIYLARDTARIKSNLPIKFESNVYANNIFSGVYTPQLTGLVNVTAAKAYTSQYMRVGNVVTVSGKIDIDATNASATQLSLKLPLASSITKDYEVSGNGQSIIGQGFIVCADVNKKTALIKFMAKDLNLNSYSYSFTYLIK